MEIYEPKIDENTYQFPDTTMAAQQYGKESVRPQPGILIPGPPARTHNI